MNLQEFSRRFDIEYNNVMSNAAPGLTESEKSVFLTGAEESVCLGIYTGVLGGAAFEATESARRSIDNLVKTTGLTEQTVYETPISSTSVFYKVPSDIWMVTYESATLTGVTPACLNPYEASVVPVTQDWYFRVKDNPFRGPSKDRVLRLDVGNHIMELVSKYPISKYLIRYMKRPLPIILEDLEDGLSIWGRSVKTECELNEQIHSLILQTAVQQAKVTYEVGLNANTGN